MRSFFLVLFGLLTALSAEATNLSGRLGLGYSNQLINDLPALSLKIQQNRRFALGGLLGFRSNEDNTLYGAGLKLYRVIFDEPLLNFYMAASVLSLSYEDEKQKARSGYQVDGTMGTEFHIEGIESIGFSFEFGVSVNKAQRGSTFETTGLDVFRGAVHFYL